MFNYFCVSVSYVHIYFLKPQCFINYFKENPNFSDSWLITKFAEFTPKTLK